MRFKGCSENRYLTQLGSIYLKVNRNRFRYNAELVVTIIFCIVNLLVTIQ